MSSAEVCLVPLPLSWVDPPPSATLRVGERFSGTKEWICNEKKGKGVGACLSERIDVSSLTSVCRGIKEVQKSIIYFPPWPHKSSYFLIANCSGQGGSPRQSLQFTEFQKHRTLAPSLSPPEIWCTWYVPFKREHVISQCTVFFLKAAAGSAVFQRELSLTPLPAVSFVRYVLSHALSLSFNLPHAQLSFTH